jgi:hypothetical protein
MANLDEVMTAAIAGEIGWMTVSEVFCLMLSACDMAGDLERTEQVFLNSTRCWYQEYF